MKANKKKNARHKQREVTGNLEKESKGDKAPLIYVQGSCLEGLAKLYFQNVAIDREEVYMSLKVLQSIHA